jgi:hypothetical protein
VHLHPLLAAARLAHANNNGRHPPIARVRAPTGPSGGQS